VDLDKTRPLLGCGVLAGAMLFAGDQLFYGVWGSGHLVTQAKLAEVMGHVAPWRLHLGSILGPLGMSFLLLASVGLYRCYRAAAPRLATLMLAALGLESFFVALQHGIFGPLGFAIRFGGPTGEAANEIWRLNSTLTVIESGLVLLSNGVWMYLTLRKRSRLPRWTAFFCPLCTVWLGLALAYLPAPLGYPLVGGWTNLVYSLWFGVLALTAKYP
jgi:hypothetical protein